MDGDYDSYAEQVSERIRHLWRSGAQLFVIGGDHGITIPVIDAMDVLGEPIYIFHVDAHLDCREEVRGVRRGYSSPLRWASTKPSNVYITVDADGLDPTEMPDVMGPAPGGLLFRQIAPIVRAIARASRIIGMDIVEVAPRFDFSNRITCITAGRLLLNAIGASWGSSGQAQLCRSLRSVLRDQMDSRATAAQCFFAQ